MFDFGDNLRQLREKHNLSQKQFGEKIGRSKSVVSAYENNLKIPSLDILTTIANLYHVSLDYLVGVEKEKNISVRGLSESQKNILDNLAAEFRSSSRPWNGGLSEKQAKILSDILREFSK